MYANCGYLIDSMRDVIVDTERPLTVGCCGCYRLITRPQLRTYRPEGRADYQIVYINDGQAWFDKTMDGTGLVVGPGTMVAFRPGEPQSYVYTADYRTDACWVHFSGTAAEEMLRSAGFTDTQHGIMHVGTDPEFRRLFDSMIRELQLRREGFRQLLEYQLRSLVIRIRRQMAENLTASDPTSATLVQDAILYFNEHFSEDISITDYAAGLGMSDSTFTGLFKQAAGMPPKRYLTSVRMKHAYNLLTATEYPVNEIALMVGYDNPLYFSRLYRKYAGLSPSDQRRLGPQPPVVAPDPLTNA
ncbi:AraC family transcriptional regulator [Bifidobacterium ramosum]|nr:AraC family transcriptional regulator [Bifidobacterium ramosum]